MTQITGGGGADTLTSNFGADSISAGAGNDSIVWSSGGGSDTIDGGAGIDTLQVGETSNQNTVSVAGVGGHIQVSDIPPSNGGPVSMLIGGSSPPPPPAFLSVSNIETLNLSAGAGNHLTASNLVNSDLTSLRMLAIRFGTNTTSEGFQINGGAVGENVTVSGSAANDISITESITGKSVTTEVANLIQGDRIEFDGGAGGDVISAANLFGRTASSAALTLSGGGGSDLINLGPWITAHGDDGDDSIMWSSNFTGHDTVDGGAGNDTLDIAADNTLPDIQLAAASGQLALKSIDTDMSVSASHIETVSIQSPAQFGTIIVGDLTGTGVQQINLALDFIGPPAGATSVLLTGGAGDDHIAMVTCTDTSFVVLGLPEFVTVNTNGADFFSIVGGAGNDVIDASQLREGSVHAELFGGAGNDTLIGGNDASTDLYGGDGNDVLQDGLSPASTYFHFNALDTGSDTITSFRTSGKPDVIVLEGFGLSDSNGFADFAAHHLVSDGHGGTDVISSNGHVIVDVQLIAPNQFTAAMFAFA